MRRTILPVMMALVAAGASSCALIGAESADDPPTGGSGGTITATTDPWGPDGSDHEEWQDQPSATETPRDNTSGPAATDPSGPNGGGGGGGDLTADSTCEQWVNAHPSAQNQVIIELVMAKEGGYRNAWREGNALMQFSAICRNSPGYRLGDIPI